MFYSLRQINSLALLAYARKLSLQHATLTFKAKAVDPPTPECSVP